MTALGRDQGVRQHRVEKRPRDLDAVMVKDGEIEFEIVADLFGGAGE